MNIQRLSTWIALRCKEPLFWRFLQVKDESSAVHQVRTRCGVASRREFDLDPKAEARLEQIINIPFAAFAERPEKYEPEVLPASVKRCRYCAEPAQLLIFGQPGYPYRASYGPTWVCVPCEAWVGCHPGTEKALGGLANAELRGWKIKAHAAFDPLWQGKMRRDQCSKGKARRTGYAWLAKQIGLPVEKTHIGYMSVEECKRVVDVCEAVFNPTNHQEQNQ
jgi:hypothetical protein